ncbi:MAG TPA: hypothetical protein VKR55_17520 [Bradyrhizobium sp.]|uniref:hypothetical protein n=1 Tax=Bradyrhizobium sp. TaxID=376 RepID=UPI002D1A55D6|nr:hypothetical protein [Bradyrhizobium sp.]HLZ03929.1 hypothetical protein [Bradyrhizobium sp.]
MSAESGHNTSPRETSQGLLESAVEIAFDFLRRTGEIDDSMEACHFLTSNVSFMMAQGERSRLMLANRAITAFQRHRETRRIALELVS